MFRDQVRYGKDPNIIRRTSQGTFNAPLKWKSGTVVFVGSYTDFCLEELDSFRTEAWDIMRKRKDMTFLLLTKRIDRFMECVPEDWGDGWDHVLVGTTIERRIYLNRLDILREVKAKRKFVSYEPALEWIPWENIGFLYMMIAGGESGIQARPSHPGWFRYTRDKCKEQGVAFEFKQWGEWACVAEDLPEKPKVKPRQAAYENPATKHWDLFERRTKKENGDLLDGVQYHEFPEMKRKNDG